MNYFHPNEFRCKCGKCDLGFDDMDPVLLDMLEEAREFAGVPFTLTSAARCLEHNRTIGSKDTSSHVTAHAVDIKATTSAQRFSILQALIAVGFHRIGIHKEFIHADTDSSKPGGVAWMY